MTVLVLDELMGETIELCHRRLATDDAFALCLAAQLPEVLATEFTTQRRVFVHNLVTHNASNIAV